MSILVRLLEQRQNPENPSTSLSQAADWLFAALGGARTLSGVTVSEHSALKFPPFWAAIRVISETIASLPLIVYRRLEPRGKQRARSHPLFRLLHDQPNPEMTAMTFREVLAAQALVWGNAYAEIERDGAGTPIGLWPLLPDRTRPERVQGVKVFFTRLPNGQEILLPPENVLHVPGLGFDGMVGFSVVAMARQAIGLGLAAEEFGSRFFAQGATAKFALEHPKALSDTAFKRIKERFAAEHTGLEQAHRTVILEEGMTLKPYSIPPDDAQFLQTRKFQVTEIARMFRLPPHKIGDMERATFSNVEQQAIDFVVDTIQPWLVRFEMAFRASLFAPDSDFFAEHLVAGLLRGDAAARFATYAQGRQWGLFSINEIRELENMNPIGPEGDVHMVPLNMVAADDLVGGGSMARALPSAGARQIEDRSGMGRHRLVRSFQPLFADAAFKLIARERKEIMKLVKQHLTKRAVPE
ncbi:hypothetical protein LCGC14_1631710, partial [marine sediment metagenome]